MSNEGADTAESTPRAPTWFDSIERVIDESIDREDTVECVCEDLTVDVPLRMNPDAERARWHFDGTVRIRTKGTRGPLAEWLRWWYEKPLDEDE